MKFCPRTRLHPSCLTDDKNTANMASPSANTWSTLSLSIDTTRAIYDFSIDLPVGRMSRDLAIDQESLRTLVQRLLDRSDFRPRLKGLFQLLARNTPAPELQDIGSDNSSPRSPADNGGFQVDSLDDERDETMLTPSEDDYEDIMIGGSHTPPPIPRELRFPFLTFY